MHSRHAAAVPFAPRPSPYAADILPGPVDAGIELGRPRWYGHSPLSA